MDKKDLEAFWNECAPIPDEVVEFANSILDRANFAVLIAAAIANYHKIKTREEAKEAAETARSIREAAIAMLRFMPSHAPEGSMAHDKAVGVATSYMEAWAARAVEVKRISWAAKLGILYSHLHSMGNRTGVELINRHLFEIQAPPDATKLSGLP